jgi:hypothetical protein
MSIETTFAIREHAKRGLTCALDSAAVYRFRAYCGVTYRWSAEDELFKAENAFEVHRKTCPVCKRHDEDLVRWTLEHAEKIARF